MANSGVAIGVELAESGGITWTGTEPGNMNPRIASANITADGPSGGGLQVDLSFQRAWEGAFPALRQETGNELVITVSFSTGVSGVSFTLFDIDHGPITNPDGTKSFVDSVSRISALTDDGAVGAVVSAYGGTGFTSDASQWGGIGMVESGGVTYYYGNANQVNSPGHPGSPETLSWMNGQLHIDFGDQVITEFSFTYSGYTPPFGTSPQSPLPPPNNFVQPPASQQTPTNQGIALGKIHFTPLTPVPEVGTVAGAAVFLLGALGFEYRRRNRRTVVEDDGMG